MIRCVFLILFAIGKLELIGQARRAPAALARNTAMTKIDQLSRCFQSIVNPLTTRRQ